MINLGFNSYKNITSVIAKIFAITGFAPVGGGGNPLRTWVLACINIVNICIYCFWTCFVKFVSHPELVSGSCGVKKWRIIYE